MYKFTKIIATFLLLATSLLAQNYINAMKVLGDISQIGPLSKAWLSAEYTDVLLYPHTTIKNNETKVVKARVKALYNGKDIAFLVSWRDSTQNSKESCCPAEYKDGFVLQFPVNYSDSSKLPYTSMGSRGRAVVMDMIEASSEELEEENLYAQRLKETYDTFHSSKDKPKKIKKEKSFVVSGPKSIVEVKDSKNSGSMQMVYKNEKWKGTLIRALKSENIDLYKGAFPVSFVIWDGSSQNIEGLENISSWVGVKLVGEKGGYELLDTLQTKADGDIQNGKKLVMENCSGCHNFNETNLAPSYMAPNLSNIGGYSTKEYLIESLIFPDAAVVEEYNANLQPDFPWYNEDEEGNLHSTMPTYEWMDEKSLKDIVAFLSTLKAKSQ